MLDKLNTQILNARAPLVSKKNNSKQLTNKFEENVAKQAKIPPS